jgi:hypothetical protein
MRVRRLYLLWVVTDTPAKRMGGAVPTAPGHPTDDRPAGWRNRFQDAARERGTTSQNDRAEKLGGMPTPTPVFSRQINDNAGESSLRQPNRCDRDRAAKRAATQPAVKREGAHKSLTLQLQSSERTSVGPTNGPKSL